MLTEMRITIQKYPSYGIKKKFEIIVCYTPPGDISYKSEFFVCVSSKDD